MKKKNWKLITLGCMLITLISCTTVVYCESNYNAATMEYSLTEGVTEQDVYDIIAAGWMPVSEIQTMINDGYLGSYISQIQALGYNVTAPAASTPEPSQPAEQPSTTASTTNGTSTKKPESTEPPVVEEPKEPEITEDETVTGQYVVITEVAFKETSAEDAEEAGTLTIGTEIEVLAKTSNNLYKLSSGYVSESALATKEAYEAAWEETNRTEATCTNAGKVTYTNALSMETKEEELEALGHKAGEWKVTKKATMFKNGEKEQTCSVCGEVLDTEVIPQTCPLALWQVIAIGVAVVAIIAGVIVFTIIIIKKKR